MNITQYRQKHRLSQAQFGHLMGGVTQSAVSQWERHETFPSGAQTAQIIRVSQGEIGMDDLFPPAESNNAESH